MSTLVIAAKFAPKGWREDPHYVDVRRLRNGRPSYSVIAKAKGYFGNPFPVTEGMPLVMALGLFEVYAEFRIKHDPMFKTMVRGLVGKTLVCNHDEIPKEGIRSHEGWVCHGQILGEIAERLAGEVAA